MDNKNLSPLHNRIPGARKGLKSINEKVPEQTQTAIFELKTLSSFQKIAKKTGQNKLKKGSTIRQNAQTNIHPPSV